VLANWFGLRGGRIALGSRNGTDRLHAWEGYKLPKTPSWSGGVSIPRTTSYTSVHIEKYEIEARRPKLGPEEITREIPKTSAEGEASATSMKLGIISDRRLTLNPRHLVGKVTPKGESDNHLRRGENCCAPSLREKSP